MLFWICSMLVRRRWYSFPYKHITISATTGEARRVTELQEHPYRYWIALLIMFFWANWPLDPQRWNTLHAGSLYYNDSAISCYPPSNISIDKWNLDYRLPPLLLFRLPTGSLQVCFPPCYIPGQDHRSAAKTTERRCSVRVYATQNNFPTFRHFGEPNLGNRG